MSKKANKAAVGAFAVGAIILAVAAILVFGSGKFFKETYEYVLFFKNSVKGLNVGAPVVLQGVEIGRVSRIALDSTADGLSFKVPIFIEVDVSKFEFTSSTREEAKAAMELDPEEYLRRMFEKGLRGRLISQSILTGQLMVELNYFPSQDRGDEVNKVSYYRGYPVIPTTVAPIDNALEKLTHIPFDAIADNLLALLDELKNLTGGENTTNMMNNIEAITSDVRSILGSKESQNLVRRLDSLLASSSSALDTINGALPQTMKSLRDAIEKLQTAINPASPQSVNLTMALNEMSNAARSIREFADMLRQNPNALLFGKGVR